MASTETILVGDIEELIVGTESIAVAEDIGADLIITIGTNGAYSNEETPTNLGKVLKRVRVQAGFSGLEVRLTAEKFDYISSISNGGSVVPVVLKLADGTIYAGDEMSIIGGVSMNTSTHAATLELRGRYFSRQ